jgi:hypothetical protein
MALIHQLAGGKVSKAAITRKRKKIQAIINANAAIKGAVDQLVGAARPKSQQALTAARIAGIASVMKKNLAFARAITDAAKE